MPSADKLQRERQAVELRRARMTYEQIGAALDPPMTAAGAWKLVQTALMRAPVLSVERFRLEENDMYDRLHRAFWPAARTGDAKAAAVVLEISKQRRRLNGTDKPIKIDAMLRTKLDAEIADLVEQMAKLTPSDDEDVAEHDFSS